MAQADLLFCVPSFLVYVYSILNDICERKYNTYSSERCMHMCHLQGIILLFSPFLFIWVILSRNILHRNANICGKCSFDICIGVRTVLSTCPDVGKYCWLNRFADCLL